MATKAGPASNSTTEIVVFATACLVIVAGGLLATAGLASFVQWRSDTQQQVAMAAQARQSIAWETPGEFKRLPQAPRTEQVLFMPAAVAQR
jgi:hypothetical protein